MRPYMPGKVDHPVYSTWAMARAFEHAGRTLLQDYLEEHEEGVGCEISIRHLAPASLGRIISTEACFKEKRGPLVVCEVQVFCGKKKIGEGTYKQFVMDKKRYKKFLATS